MDFQELLPIGVTLILTGLVLAFGLQILGDTKTDMCDGSLEHFSGDDCYTCPNSTWNYWNSTALKCMNSSSSLTNAQASYVSLGNAEFNASEDASTGVGTFPEKIPLVATVVVAVVIIGVLIRYFTTK